MLIKTKHYSIKLEAGPTLVYLCLLPLLLALGFWQLGRAEEKKALLGQQTQSVAAETVHLSAATVDNAELQRYKKVELNGRYDNEHQFLIDNQISGGKAGYFVLTPFTPVGEIKAVLVNRGWLPLNQNRLILPKLPVTKIQATVTGQINQFPSVGVKLAGAEIPTDGWPSVVQVVDIQILVKKLGYPLFQFQVELDKSLPDGFKREWHTTTIMLPEQHIGYAIQWFALAVTLTILFIWYSFKKHND